MDNILLIFLNDLEREEEFNEIINKFDENGYKMYLLDNIKEDKYFSFDNLPYLVEYYKNEHQNVNKVVVLSNSRDLIFSWYRCYNSIVDDFVYFLDEDEKNYFLPSDRHFNFYKNLSQFNNIEKETIEGKIYININFNNYEKIIGFLLKENNFLYFDDFIEFDFKKIKADKKYLCKTYFFNGYEYMFGINNTKAVEKIKIIENAQKNYLLNDLNLENVVKNDYIIPYLTVLFYKTGQKALSGILVLLYKKLKEIDKNKQVRVYEKLFIYINNGLVDFKEKIYISSLLVMIHNGDERLAEFMMDTLIKDEEYLEYHYSVLYNILFYNTHDNLIFTNDFYIKQRQEMIKLGKFYKEKFLINVDKNKNRDIKLKVAIHYDQLLNMLHSPTSNAIQFANNLKNYYSDCEVKIFVEDNFIVNSSEVTFPYSYSSVPSYKYKEIHKELLSNKDIEVYYSDPYKNKIERTREIVEEIVRFNPDVIYSTSDVSLAREILYPHYPIVYQTHGSTNFSTLCDVYVVYGNSQRKRVLEINNHVNLIDESKIIINEPPKSEIIQRKKDYEKSDLGINKNSFVMVTVGNRLDVEMSNEFIDLISSFIIQKDNVVWIVVGPKEIPYMINNYRNLIEKRKIIRIHYEEDLISLYKICDVYVNPVRNGGAGSVRIAIQCGVPAIVEKSSQDSVFVVGEENCVNDANDSYIKELNMLYESESYRSYKSELMKSIISKRKDWKAYINEYISIFNLAKRRYDERNRQ